MSWDGSHLGEARVISRWVSPHGETMARVEASGKTYFGYLGGPDAMLSAFIEAAKPMFGLEQRGHHLLTIDSKEAILYYAHCETSVSPGGKRTTSVREYALSSLDADHPLRSHPDTAAAVRRILAFRDICLLWPLDERAVLVRVVDGGHVFLSFRETKTCPCEDKHRIARATHQTWFGSARGVESTLRETFGNDEHVGYRLGCRLERLVDAYGSQLSEYRYRICKRLALQLQ